jgi:hypothetical protein
MAASSSVAIDLPALKTYNEPASHSHTARRSLLPLVIGVLLAVGVAALAKFTRFDEDRSFYATVLVIIASYYVLFAVLGGSRHALVWELVVAVAFSTAAILGALLLPVLVGIGIMAHGLFDLVHDLLIENVDVPSWWPSFCASVDVLLGLWVIFISPSRLTCSMR